MSYSGYIVIGLGIIILLGFSLLLFWVFLQFQKMLSHFESTMEKVTHFTNSDPLTSLPNRVLFFENIKVILDAAKQNRQKIALLFMDLDNFRGIKDTLGYAIGDALLQAIAKRLLTIAQNKKEVLARLSSDQFTLVLDNAEEKNINTVVSKLLGALSEPFSIHGHDVTTSASVGISIYPDDGDNVESLLKSAGIARYHAKQRGSNTYSFYTREMDTKLSEQRTIETHLRKAISKGEFVVCYQPKVDIKTRKIAGAEALLQWNNPELGKVSPAQFIPLAEQTGLIVSIGDWVLKEACAQTKKWHSEGYSGFSIAINVSAYQFKTGDIAEQIARVLWDSKLDPTLLELELTESLVMENVEKSLLMLRVLKTMGIRLSIDDFGTGYSSLSQIRKFPVDSLKIDQSFVKNIQAGNANDRKSSDDRAIITTIITMAKQLGLKIVAEGVETEPQFDFLKQEGCDIIQGYLFSRPIPAEDFSKLLAENWAQYNKK